MLELLERPLDTKQKKRKKKKRRVFFSFFLGGLLEISDFPGQPRENENKAKRERELHGKTETKEEVECPVRYFISAASPYSSMVETRYRNPILY